MTQLLNKKAVGFTMLAGAMAVGALAGQAYAQDGDFRNYLAARYHTLAKGENQGWDIEDSTYLEAAQVNALSGGPIAPHPLTKVRYVQATPAQLQEGRDFLINVGANGAAEKMPGPYARALSAFDCWVEQQEAEPNADHNMQYCREMFVANARQLESLRTTKVVAVKQVENLRTLHTVYFDWDKSDIKASERQKLEAAREMLSDARNGRLIIRGFADASGNQAYNQGLSERRARAVANTLALPEDRFEVRTVGYGETNLHVPTPDGVREQLNRVVDISVNADVVK